MSTTQSLEPREQSSLAGPGGRIKIPLTGSTFRRFFAFAGPGFIVSVGYMDPGNWGTDIPAGAQYGYRLLWVVLASSLMAMFLQAMCARLGIATGRDLAQLCRERTSKPVGIVLWLMAEVAIIACDLAEVIGSAVALKLLFGIPLLDGVFLTAFDVLLLMGLMRFGFRKLEATVLALVGMISLCFVFELWFAQPDWKTAAISSVVPALHGKDQLLLAVGILGATVMPHNLYLHSAMVQTRVIGKEEKDRADAIKHNTWDTVIALSIAFLVNAAILILAAATFHRHGQFDIPQLEDAYRILTPMLGKAAAIVFAVGLLAAGQSSTITGTLAGQVVMEGFLHWKIKPWLRRLISRTLAIIPAALIVGGSGSRDTTGLIILSQVILSMQLPFAIFPLIAFTTSKKEMGRFASNKAWTFVGYAVAVVITVLNGIVLLQQFKIIQ